MRKTMSRLTRAAAMTAVGALLTAGAVTVAPAASAATCETIAGIQLCGAVKNRTGKTMAITRSFSGSHFCDVWNWDGGTGNNWNHHACTQESWGSGTRGGNGTGVDVDAFSFANQGYHERFTRVGTWHWRTQGVWTKIRSGEIADCGIGDQNAIWCTVLWQ